MLMSCKVGRTTRVSVTQASTGREAHLWAARSQPAFWGGKRSQLPGHPGRFRASAGRGSPGEALTLAVALPRWPFYSRKVQEQKCHRVPSSVTNWSALAFCSCQVRKGQSRAGIDRKLPALTPFKGRHEQLSPLLPLPPSSAF